MPVSRQSHNIYLYSVMHYVLSSRPSSDQKRFQLCHRETRGFRSANTLPFQGLRRLSEAEAFVQDPFGSPLLVTC